MKRFGLFVLFVLLLGAAATANAAVITQMLGTANYTNGETVGTGTFASNPSGDPAPFDRLIGDKTNGPNPSTSFTFSGYGGPIASPISSATLEFGLYDGASPSPSRRPAPDETSLSVRPVTFLSVIYTASALKPVYWKIIGVKKYYNQ